MEGRVKALETEVKNLRKTNAQTQFKLEMLEVKVGQNLYAIVETDMEVGKAQKSIVKLQKHYKKVEKHEEELLREKTRLNTHLRS